MRKTKVKAIIFDMDGVLVDARNWHFNAFNDALKIFGINISASLHNKKFDGKPTKIKLEILSESKLIPKKLIPFINSLKQKYTNKYIYSFCHPVFQHHYLLSYLRSNHYKIGLCSNSIRETVDLMLTKNDLLKFFDVTFSNEDIDLPKPSPRIYLQCMKQLKVKPSQTLIIEDNHIGIESAQNSGAHVLEVQSPLDVNFINIRKKLAEING